MKINRIISTLLAVIMLLSAFVMTVGATDTDEKTTEYTYKTSNAQPSMSYRDGTTYVPPQKEGEAPGQGVPVDTPEKKLATMDLRLEKDGYQLYVDAYSGEIAIKEIASGELLFSNPYDAGAAMTSAGAKASTSTKEHLLSQLVVKFTNITTGSTDEFHSFAETIQGESDDNPYPASQINVKNIKNGIRVEYSIGREEARLLLPRQIEKSVFETQVLAVIEQSLADQGGAASHTYRRFNSFYILCDLSQETSADKIAELERKYPITKKMAVYVLDGNAKSNVMNQLEGTMKTYCQSYTYEDLDEHHLQTEYESEDLNPPLFRMALEYTVDKDGLSVRLPANGIRFNESLYRLDSIDILPYMGAGENPNSGYTFFPDGSGTIFDFEDIAESGTSLNIRGKVYGPDFAYHSITEKHQEIIRYPVFGLKETVKSTETVEENGVTTTVETEKTRGYLAIVEEGEAMMELSAYHAVRNHPFNTVRMSVYPRPQDSYNISDAISVGSNEEWTVVSSRKYTGSYRVRYIMLTDDKVAAENNITDYYSCDYVGMAKAYREYLEDKEVLTRLTEDDVKADIPLYINTFGSVPTTKKILSIPVNTMEALTTFDDIQTMYNDFAAEDITNINFVLSGYTKGGLEMSEYPNKVKWEKTVGGKKGFEQLMSFANENDVGIFPDFDFAFLMTNTLFDGVTLKKHAVKTIDNRYTSKRVYSATKQTHMSYFELAISPSVYSDFYEKFTEDYLEYTPTGISVGSLGTYLVSDFDEDDPYNREDSKQFTIDAFAHFDDNYASVMTSGGNAYSWKYVDHITDVALDSSRYAQAYASIPFVGMVLHGYVQIAGTPINMEANIDYAMLKAIESGASINFTLSYKNTSLLKESEYYSKHYSIRYDIWFDDVVELYSELNAVLKDVQTSIIVDHEFVDGVRVPDNDELLADAEAELKARLEFADALAEAESDEVRAKLLAARKAVYKETANITSQLATTLGRYDRFVAIDINGKLADYNAAVAANDAAAISAALGALNTEFVSLYTDATHILNGVTSIKNSYNAAVEGLDYLKANSDFSTEFLAEVESYITAIMGDYTTACNWETAVYTKVSDDYNAIKHITELKAQEFTYTPEQNVGSNNNQGTVVPEISVANKYISDENQIAVVTYSNGTVFVLNFNNYAVSTVVGGETYTIGAYGYVILKK